jgi:hypothetical protein
MRLVDVTGFQGTDRTRIAPIRIDDPRLLLGTLGFPVHVPTTPMLDTAFLHYVGGSGTPRWVSIQDLDLSALEIENVPGVANVIAERRDEPGSYPVDTFGNFEFPGFTDSALLLGNVTVHVIGTVTVSEGGTWGFNGKVFIKPDVFDFDRHTPPRPFPKELIVTGIRTLPGARPYTIYIVGHRRWQEFGIY